MASEAGLPFAAKQGTITAQDATACLPSARNPPNPFLAFIENIPRQAIGRLDKKSADIEALERLASFLGTLFVKHDITETDERVLAAAAARRPNLKGGSPRRRVWGDGTRGR